MKTVVEDVDVIIIGAGVVGLAVARALAMAGRDVLILERESSIGTGVSSRNSEVIHAGIYYPPGTRKATLCVQGKEQLYDYCLNRNIPVLQCGKLLVATSLEQIDGLKKVLVNAHSNGVSDLRWLTPQEVNDIEPAIHCVAALFSPSTGIVDSHALMISMQGEAEAHGALLVARSSITSGKVTDEGVVVRVQSPDGDMDLRAKCVVNCAGLSAVAVARLIEGPHTEHLPDVLYAKGSYFSLTGKSPCRHLIYPLPEPGGLGTHLTIDLGGQAKFGPNVEWLQCDKEEDINYNVDANLAGIFVDNIKKYLPHITADMLEPAYSGVRPKVKGLDQASNDFIFLTSSKGTEPALINLLGIESPGLTACLAIAEKIASIIRCPSEWQPRSLGGRNSTMNF